MDIRGMLCTFMDCDIHRDEKGTALDHFRRIGMFD
jgi:hypothetical protein